MLKGPEGLSPSVLATQLIRALFYLVKDTERPKAKGH